ncbi:MAG: hypothetical protein KF773_38075 [Deltaproteobacteria bacterium]|nr:hypothetical protein [Deltaproteobacteria bacterium]
MKKPLVFAGIWVGLFAATVAVMAIKSAVTSEADAAAVTKAQEDTKNATRAKLATSPRRSSGIAADLADGVDPQKYPGLEQAIHEAVVAARDRLLGCTRYSMGLSLLQTQYLEVSLRLTHRKGVEPLPTQPRTVTVSDSTVERASTPFTAEEQKCLEAVFNDLELKTESELPADRTFYPLCFNKP